MPKHVLSVCHALYASVCIALSVCQCLLCLYAHVHGILDLPACNCSSECMAIRLQGIVGLGPLPRRHRTLTQGPSLQLEQAVRLETGELEAQEPRGLVRQSVELRRQLQEEQASYRRKLQAYQEGQQRQAQLVQRLQAKVRAAHPHPCPHSTSLGPHLWAHAAPCTLPDSAVQEAVLRAGEAADGQVY